LGVVPGQRLCEVLGRVAFPSFAAVQRDADRLRRGFLRMMHVSFLVAGPLAFFVPLTARPLIHAVYGPQWLPAAAAVQVLSAAATGLMVARWSGSGQPWQVAWTVGSMGLVYLALIARDSFVWSASIPRPLGGHRGPMWGAR